MAAAARRPPLPVTVSAVAADTKAKKGRKEVTFGSESSRADKGQRREERSLNETPPAPAPAPATERKSAARERRRAEREDDKKAAAAATSTSKVRDECGGDGASVAAAGGENVPGAISGKN